MKQWRFFDFMLNPRRNAIEDWLSGLSMKVRAEFEVLLSNLAVTAEWDERDVRPLRGGKAKGKGLREICFKVGGVQHRVIGCSGPQQKQFTLLIGCSHKDQIYDPPSAIETAIKRKNQVDSGDGVVYERTV